MPIFLVNLWLDGYDTEEEMEAACNYFIYSQLNMTASSVCLIQVQGGDTSADDMGKMATQLKGEA